MSSIEDKEDLLVERLIQDEFRGCKNIDGTMDSLYRQVLDRHPIMSYKWKTFMAWYKKLLKMKYSSHKEYSLCMQKQKAVPYKKDFELYKHLGLFDDTFVNITSNYPLYEFEYRPRYDVEWNPLYIHFVVGGIIHTADDHYVVLKRKSDNFVGKYTSIMGHVAYTPETVSDNYAAFFNDTSETDVTRLMAIFAKNLLRELREEVCYTGTLSDIDISKWRYEPPRFISPLDINYYHAGFIFMVNSKMHDSEFESGEPDKNDIVVFDKYQMDNLTYPETDDGWLFNAIRKLM